MFRRLIMANQAKQEEPQYIQDGLVFWLDGIDRGTTDGNKWVDLIGGQEFTAVNSATWGADHLIAPCEMRCPGWTNPALPNTGTCEAVLLCTSTGNVTMLQTKGVKNVVAGFGIGTYGNNWLLTNYSAVKITVTKNIMPINAAHAVSYNNARILVDGTAATRGTVDYYYGRTDYASIASTMAGKLWCIRMYDRQLTAEEMLYNQQVDNERFNLGLNI